MNIFINLLILCTTIFLYIHIYHHIKCSNYLEVYEIDKPSKDILEELCNLKQPLLIHNIDVMPIDYEYVVKNYGNFDIKILNNENNSQNISLKLETACDLFNKDSSSIYISENNKDFLEETSLIKEFKNTDMYFRPYNVSYIDYDMIFGTKNCYTKLKYNLNCRNFINVLNGKIEITLCLPKNAKNLYVNKDYEELEFYSDINIHNIQEKYKDEFSKIKCLRVVLEKNKVLQIPAYWFYSIKIIEENSLISVLKYRSVMNTAAIFPELFMNFLQSNNIKHNLTKIIS
tara:strand:+ start:1214 stop:2074 length:861 start_codon:yes stop_codon:yes gene_type:complete